MFLSRRRTNSRYAHEKILNMVGHQEDVNTSHSEMPLHTQRVVIIFKNWKITGVGEDVEKLELSCIADGNVK